ncbi:MAG: DUF3540 domain-containing protein [Polyangiaceae bacterium]
MTSSGAAVAPQPTGAWVRQGRVVASAAPGTVCVAIRRESGEPDAVLAQLSSAAMDAQAGDEVVVLGEGESAFVMSVLGAARGPSARAVVARSGASASLDEHAGRERLVVRDRDDKVLFEVDAETGRTVISAARGNLALRAPDGDLELEAKGAVRVRSQAFDVSAEKAELALDDVAFAGERLRAKIGDVRNVFGRLETVTQRLFETAKSAFRNVEDLSQLRAGRVRTLVKKGYYVRGGHAAVEAEEDVKLDAKQIRLG